MRLLLSAVVLGVGAMAGVAGAQMVETPVSQAAHYGAREFGAVVQGGVGTEDRTNYSFVTAGGQAGMVLTDTVGRGLFRGNFEYGVRVLPYWQSFTPKFSRIYCYSANNCTGPYTVGGTATGVEVDPIILRWNFTHGQRIMPWVQAAGGVVWTNHKYPAVGNLNPLDTATNGSSGDTSVWNFVPQGGLGMHYFLKPRRSLDFSANAVHLSSASLGDKNPGVNASVQFTLGYTWWK